MKRSLDDFSFMYFLVETWIICYLLTGWLGQYHWTSWWCFFCSWVWGISAYMWKGLGNLSFSKKHVQWRIIKGVHTWKKHWNLWKSFVSVCHTDSSLSCYNIWLFYTNNELVFVTIPGMFRDFDNFNGSGLESADMKIIWKKGCWYKIFKLSCAFFVWPTYIHIIAACIIWIQKASVLDIYKSFCDL